MIDDDNAQDDESILSDYITKDDDSDESSTQSDKGSSNNDEFLNDFEDYSHSTFDFLNTSKLPKEDRFTWIIIWIMKFRSNYNLPNTAIEDLIKFIRLLLNECNVPNHESFPKSLYKAKNYLGLIDRFVTFAACQKYHKLNKNEDMEHNNQITKCRYVEFPNSITRRLKQYQTPLAKRITSNNESSIMPELIYPVASIRQQLHSMF